MAIADNALQTLKPQPYARVRGLVQDGDLLLCSANDPFSRMIRWSTGSPWSHMALAYRIQPLDRLMVFEAVAKLGVRTVPLSLFITRTSGGIQPYPGRILLARDRRMQQVGLRRLKAMYDFAFAALGKEFATTEILKIAARILLGRLDIRMPRRLGPTDEFICSEYIARCFAKAGLEIPWDGLGFVAPCDFAQSPDIEAVAQIRTR